MLIVIHTATGDGTVTTPRAQLPEQVVMQQASSPMATTR